MPDLPMNTEPLTPIRVHHDVRDDTNRTVDHHADDCFLCKRGTALFRRDLRLRPAFWKWINNDDNGSGP